VSGWEAGAQANSLFLFGFSEADELGLCLFVVGDSVVVVVAVCHDGGSQQVSVARSLEVPLCFFDTHVHLVGKDSNSISTTQQW